MEPSSCLEGEVFVKEEEDCNTEDLTTSNIEVKFEASEYVLAKHEPDEPPSPDPDTESVMIIIKRKKSGGRPRLYPGESVQERNRARYKAWHALQREKFPEKVKLQSKRKLLKIKKKRSQVTYKIDSHHNYDKY